MYLRFKAPHPDCSLDPDGLASVNTEQKQISGKSESTQVWLIADEKPAADISGCPGLTWIAAIGFIQSWQQILLLQGEKSRKEVIIVIITDAYCVLKQLLPLQTLIPAAGCRALCVCCSLSEELPSDKRSISPGSCSQ